MEYVESLRDPLLVNATKNLVKNASKVGFRGLSWVVRQTLDRQTLDTTNGGHVQCLLCLGFVMSCLCYVQCLLCIVFVMSGVCYV